MEEPQLEKNGLSLELSFSTRLNTRLLEEAFLECTSGIFSGMVPLTLPNRGKPSIDNSQDAEDEFLPQPRFMSRLKLDVNYAKQLFSREEEIEVSMQSRSNLADQFFQQRKNQQETIMKRRQELQRLDPKPQELGREWRLDYLNHTIRSMDMATLKPGKDINDVIINFYLQLIQSHFINEMTREKLFCFNTYFTTQLLGKELMTDEPEMERIGRSVPSEFQKRIQRNYQSVQKWTKKANLFSKQLIIIPVNMPGHWCLILVLRPCALVDPSLGKAHILFLDSMNERNKSVIEAIRIYLQCEFQTKNFHPGRTIAVDDVNLPDYQLLVPRQTNFHDCGLYMLSNVEAMVLNRDLMDADYSDPLRRQLLSIYPRSLIFRLRNRLHSLFCALEQSKGRESEAIDRYLRDRRSIFDEAESRDYDEIDKKQLNRYLSLTNKQSRSPEEDLGHRISFYLKPDFNFFEYSEK